jgi:hypothetical protein
MWITPFVIFRGIFHVNFLYEKDFFAQQLICEASKKHCKNIHSKIFLSKTIKLVGQREMCKLSVGKLTTISCYDKGHSKICTELMNHDPFLSAPSDFEGVNPIIEINFQVKFPRREEWAELTTLPATGDVVFYTRRVPYGWLCWS